MTLPPLEAELALLQAVAEDAGAIARRYWKNAPRVWDKGVEGPVTEADLAVNDHFRAALLAARPGYGWLSEEGPDDPARTAARRCFVLDPIDGTRSFIDGQEGFALSVALVEDGAPVAGVVHLPVPRTTYAATADGPATRDGAPIRVSDGTRARVLTASANLAPEHWRAPPAIERAFRPSVACRLCLVAEGAFDAALSLKPAWEWDIAAGALIVARAGGTATDRHGGPLCFNRPDPRTEGLVAAGPALHAALLGGLMPAA